MPEIIFDKKLKIGVLMGGISVESEVSYNSGRTVCDHIDIDRYEVVPIFQTVSSELYVLPWKFLHRGKTSDFTDRLPGEAERVRWDDLKSLVDFIYIALHGQYGEDGSIQGMLEVLGVPYLGAKVFGSAIGIDKVFQKKVLALNNINVPKDVSFSPEQVKNISLEKILEKLKENGVNFPCLVKPSLEGSSVGIGIAFAPEDLIGLMRKASFESVTREQPILIEELVSGMEFTSISIRSNKHNNKWIPLSVTEIIHEKGTFFHDYDQKYMPGRSWKITPARCSDSVQDRIKNICMKVGDILGFATFFRVDGFVTEDNRIIIIDPNTLSGMGPASILFHQSSLIGMNHTNVINYLINFELSRHNIYQGKISCSNIGEKKREGMKKRVVVLLGGESTEREISFESGRNVCYKIPPSKYDVIPMFVDSNMNLYELSQELLILNTTKEIEENLDKKRKILWNDLPKISDFVFIALHGGKGEGGEVQGALDLLGLPYNGSGPLASSLCMDKYRANDFLLKSGFDVPKSFLLTKDRWDNLCKENKEEDTIDKFVKDAGLPLIIKPHNDGCSILVNKVSDKNFVKKCLINYFDSGRSSVLIEEFISGMELTCGVLGNDDCLVFPPSYTVAENEILSIEEKFLPGAGENRTPAPLSQSETKFVQSIVGNVYKSIGCKGYARIDCFYQSEKDSPTGKARVVILEINSLPGLTPATCFFHQAAEVGMKPMEFIGKVIDLGFKEHSYKLNKLKPDSSIVINNINYSANSAKKSIKL